MTGTCQVLLISGSLRAGSTNTAMLRSAMQAAPEWITCVLYDGLDTLPHFDPDRDTTPLPAPVAALRAAIHTSDAILFCTPEYAGALPGSFKNLLDWTIGDDQPGSIYQKPVAWINVSGAPGGAADAHESLQKVLTYANAAVITDACVSIPVTRGMIGDDRLIADLAVRPALVAVLTTLASSTTGDDHIA